AHLPGWLADIVLPAAGSIGGLLLLFGGLSPYFERQADVYAARTIQWQNGLSETVGHRAPVGTYGANLFGSALHRVAVINGIPIHTRTLSHGSIAGRIDYLHQLSGDPTRTNRFDRIMMWIYVAVIGLLLTFGFWSVIVLSR
ncbi:MAG: hypothetical protein JO353_12820, partial [Phycisphaerae bacterium]|nr:hypothetical protein [Phycisphaerae bacterium]